MLSVVICTHNRPALLARCLEALTTQCGSFEVVVVDQSDTPASIPNDLRFRCIPNAERGLAAGRNAGVRDAMGNVIAFLDDDSVPDPGYVRVIETVFEEDLDLAAVAGRILTVEDGRPYSRVHDESFRALNWGSWVRFMGGNFAIRREVVDKVGPFDERFGAGRRWASGDETDYFFRLMYENCRVAYVPEVIVRHPRERVLTASREIRSKLLAYGRGQGALIARHLLEFANYRMVGIFFWWLAKPSLRSLQYAITLRLSRTLLHAAIVQGKLAGFAEFIRTRAWKQRNAQ